MILNVIKTQNHQNLIDLKSKSPNILRILNINKNHDIDFKIVIFILKIKIVPISDIGYSCHYRRPVLIKKNFVHNSSFHHDSYWWVILKKKN